LHALDRADQRLDRSERLLVGRFQPAMTLPSTTPGIALSLPEGALTWRPGR